MRNMRSENPARPDLIARWLWLVAALVVLMIVIGGITRLTESGLSITEWKPVSGIVPPLSDAAWQSEFARYQASSQYRLLNAGMGLAAFKSIFFWEYGHRLLGRVIGLAFAGPLIWFLVKRQIPRVLAARLAVLLVLGGLQGAVGWLMVASGLVDGRDKVAPAMLAAHLGMALLLLSALVWTALDGQLLARAPSARPARPSRFAGAVTGVLCVQIGYGALTAGMRAGHVSSSWPLMNDHFVPRGIDWSHGVGFALVSDPYLVHFVHRWWAWVAFLALILLARRVRPLARRASVLIHITVGTQILLGIATVMSGVWLPLAALHQLTGALTLVAAIYGAHVLGRGDDDPVAWRLSPRPSLRNQPA
jgi:cytochrome c oxidase assembly protein subunit 15